MTRDPCVVGDLMCRPASTTWAWVICMLGLAVCAAGGMAAQADEATANPTVGPASAQPFIAEAMEKSAELAALDARIKAAEALVEPASALPDPMASLGLVNIPVDSGIRLDQDTMSGLELMLSQDVPRTRKRRLSGQAQTQEAEMLRARYGDARNNLARMVKQGYLDLQSLDEQIKIADQNKRLAQVILAAVEAQYATGRGMLQDVFQAQIRVSQMLDMLVQLRQQRATAATRMNKLLYRPPTQPVAEAPPLQRTAVALDEKAIAARALSFSPQLQEMHVKLEQQGTKLNLAQQEIKPDFRFEFRYMLRQRMDSDFMSGTDMWSAVVGMNLPWVYRRHKADQDVAAAQAGQSAAAQDVVAMRNELGQMVESMIIDVKRADQRLSLVETALLPQAEGALASSRASYETGQLPFVSLLDNQMSFYNQQIRRAELLQDRERSLAELEYLAGGSLSFPETKDEPR